MTTATDRIAADRTEPLNQTIAGSDEPEMQLLRRRLASERDRETALVQEGRLFGGYTLIRKLASGGMGVVYLARQESLRRSVALKMILAGDHASAEEIRRFQQEAEAAAQLDHPGIVPIFEVGENLGLHYFSMAYVGAGSLADRVKNGPLPPRQAVELVRQIAEAVGYAHHRGIIHRDLKPANILMDEDGHPKVSDFGLAKQVSGLSQLTLTGQVMGTPSYMAPEQAAGRTESVGPVSDLYSLGAMLFCLLTGRPPFQAATPVETLRQVTEKEPVSPRQLNSAVDRDVETVCLKCLQKEPEKRYADAAALAEDLRRILAREPILARPVGSVERLWRWCRRNRAVAALIAGVMVSLLAGIVVSSFFAAHAMRKEAQARQAQALSDRRWYAAEIGIARHDWENGRIATVIQRLEALRPSPTGGPDLRGFEWHYLNRLCHLDLRTLRGSSQPLWSIAFCPEGRYLASAGGVRSPGNPGTIRLWDAAGGELIRAWEGHAECANCVAFSLDGMRLATAGGLPNGSGEVKIWDPAAAREILRLAGTSSPIHSLAFSSDGRRLAGAAGGYDDVGRSLPGEVLVWDLVGGKPVRRLRGHPGAVLSVAFSPDGRWLASSDSEGTVTIWDAVSGDQVLALVSPNEPDRSTLHGLAFSHDSRLFAAGGVDRSIRVWDAGRWDARGTSPQKPLFILQHASPINGIAFSADGKTLAAGYDDQTVLAWDLPTRTIRLTLRGHVDAVSSVAFSPDGWRLASASRDQTIKIWDATQDRRTVAFREHRQASREVRALAFSRDGRRMATASADRAVRIWDVATGLVVRTLRGHMDWLGDVAFSPDGRWLATAAEDRTVMIWEVVTGKRLRTIAGFPTGVVAVAYSPDGRWLACASGGWKNAGNVRLIGIDSDVQMDLPTGGTGPLAGSGYLDVAFSPDGRRLAASCNDSTIRIWDLESTGPARVLRGHSEPAQELSFSPDGQRIASAGSDRSVRLWDAATGATIATLNGHTSRVECVAFSPDGRRLATADLDYVVKLWDPRTLEQEPRAQEIDSIVIPWVIAGLAFHPDGRRLAIGGSFGVGSDLALDHSLAIWDAREPERGLAEQDEAQSRLAYWFERRLTAEQVGDRLRQDAALSEPVRIQALEMVEPYGQARARGEAEDRIDRLAKEGLLQAEIVERLRRDPGLSEPARREALDLARSSLENPPFLDSTSRSVVLRPGASTSAYRRAHEKAMVACRHAPYRATFQVTRGIAEYRLGKYDDALKTLSAADTSTESRDHRSECPRLAFLAMTEYRLGRRDRAVAALMRCQDVLRQSARTSDEEATSLRREAEQLIQPGRVRHPSAAPER